MKNPVLLVGFLLTLLCELLYVFEPPLVSSFSHNLYDALLRVTAQPPKSDAIAVVDIDEQSLARYGQFPWPRHQVGRLIQRIVDAGARVAALDIMFSEPDHTSPVAVRNELKQYFGLDWALPDGVTDYDQYMARALASGPTILGAYFDLGADEPGAAPVEMPPYHGRFYARGGAEPGSGLLNGRRATFSLPILSEAASNNAFFSTTPDRDSVVRESPIACRRGGRVFPAVALESVRMFLGVGQVGMRYEHGVLRGFEVGDRFISTDAAGQMRINYRRARGTGPIFPTLSAADVLEGRVDPGVLKGRMVFIGTSAPALRDLRATPMNPSSSGVEIHATMADNMMAGDPLRVPTWWVLVDVLSILVVGALVSLVVARKRALASWALVSAGAALLVGASLALLKYLHLVLVPVWGLTTTIVVFPSLIVMRYRQQESHVRWIRKAFGAMVSDKILAYLESQPEHVIRQGRKTEATILFMDVVSFTEIARALDPAELSQLINEYLSPMTEIIMARDGFVDKYVGDMIMAEWGVPNDVPDHAMEACLAALDQLDALAKLNPVWKEKYGHTIHVRIGINTGLVTAGNMGSHRRFQYTVMGDAVNWASRLEPLNRTYGTTILIGERTRQLIGERLATRRVDRVQLPGRPEPTEVYELLPRSRA